MLTVEGKDSARALSANALMLTWEFPPRIIGGISTHVYHLSKFLARRGASVHVVTSDFPNVESEQIAENVKISRVDCSRISQSDFFLWTYYMNLLMIERSVKILEHDSFGLIHAHDWMVGHAALELKKRYKIPLVTTIHATEIGRAQGALKRDYQAVIDNIEQILIRESDQIICCSDYMLHHLQGKNNFAAPIDVIPNAVDATIFNRIAHEPQTVSKLRSRWGLSNGKKIILYVGRLVNEKGIYTLIEAFETLQKGISNVSLVMVGEGPMKESVAAEVYRRGMGEHIRFAGFVDNDTLVALYRLSDVFVLPSLYEPFGIVVLEAMASSVPVVVSDVGGLSDIVENGVTGLKVPPGDPNSLCMALVRLLLDPVFAKQLAQNAYRNVIEKYNWDSVAERTLNCYRRIVSSPGRTHSVYEPDFLTDESLLQLLLRLGATKYETAKTASELSDFVGTTEALVKHALGRLASSGYVSNSFDGTPHPGVRYYVIEKGVIKASADFS